MMPATGSTTGHTSPWNSLFYRFFFVHELGHWMQDEVLRQRKDPLARQADRNSETARWQYETVANRISVAWWREHDPQYLAKLVNDFRAIQEKLPNPVPSGESPKVFLRLNTKGFLTIQTLTDGFSFRW